MSLQQILCLNTTQTPTQSILSSEAQSKICLRALFQSCASAVKSNRTSSLKHSYSQAASPVNHFISLVYVTLLFWPMLRMFSLCLPNQV